MHPCEDSAPNAERYIAEYGDICWEADVLPATAIEAAIRDDIATWLDAKRWKQRDAEIKRTRKLL